MAKERQVEYILSMRDEASRIHKRFADAVSRDAISITSAAKSAGAALGAMLSISAATDFVQKYAEAESQSLKLSIALANVGATGKDVTDMLEEQALTLSKKTAIDDDEIRALQGTLVAMTGNVDVARQLLPAVLDLSRGMGISTEAAARMFAKTNEGAEGLSRLGIKIGDTNSELERTQKIAAEVEKRWGGMAAQWAQTPEGQLAKMNVDLENVKEHLGKILFDGFKPLIPAIELAANTAKVLGPIFYSAYSAIARFTSALLAPLALTEKFLNLIGVTSSQYFSNLVAGQVHAARGFASLAMGINQTNEAIVKSSGTMTTAVTETYSLSQKVIDLKKSLDALEPGTKRYHQIWVQLTIAQRDFARSQQAAYLMQEKTNQSWADFGNILMKHVDPAMKNTTAKLKDLQVKAVNVNVNLTDSVSGSMVQMGQIFGANMETIDAISQATYSSIGSSMQSIFQGATGGARSMMNQVVNMIITTVEGLLVAAAAAGKAWGVISFGASIPKDIALLAGGFALLESARSILNRNTTGFNEGGAAITGDGYGRSTGPNIYDSTVVYDGRLVPSNSGRSNRTVNITVVNNAPITSEQALHDLGNSLMRRLGVTNIADAWRSDDHGINLAVS